LYNEPIDPVVETHHFITYFEIFVRVFIDYTVEIFCQNS